jgi:hypothetical protein
MHVYIIIGSERYESSWVEEVHDNLETAELRAAFKNDEARRNEEDYRYLVQRNKIMSSARSSTG